MNQAWSVHSLIRRASRRLSMADGHDPSRSPSCTELVLLRAAQQAKHRSVSSNPAGLVSDVPEYAVWLQLCCSLRIYGLINMVIGSSMVVMTSNAAG